MTYTVVQSSELPSLGHLSVQCSPTDPAAPPPDHLGFAIREGRCFTAYDESGNVVGNAVVSHGDESRIDWLTVPLQDAAEVWGALGEAIGRPVWGNVGNPDLRAALLQHPRLTQDPDNEEILRWQ